MKWCPRCHMQKPFSAFGRHRSTKDGYQYWCLECKREDGRRYQAEIRRLIRLGRTAEISAVTTNGEISPITETGEISPVSDDRELTGESFPSSTELTEEMARQPLSPIHDAARGISPGESE